MNYLGQYFLAPVICSAILKARAEMVSDELTPKAFGIMDPSTTYKSS